MKPEVFAALLIEKLEKVKRDTENQEKLDRKLMEVRNVVFLLLTISSNI